MNKILTILLAIQGFALALDTNYIQGNHPILESLSTKSDVFDNVSVCLEIEQYIQEGYSIKALKDTGSEIHLHQIKSFGIVNSKNMFLDILTKGCLAYNKNKSEQIYSSCGRYSEKRIRYCFKYFNRPPDTLIISIDPEEGIKENAIIRFKEENCYIIIKEEFIKIIRKALKELIAQKLPDCCK